QEQQINNYQQLLRTSEENLKKCQQIINQKTNQLEQLEQEKELIAEELELASSKIKDLETALLSANGKIGGLEARIKELESKGDNSGEIERLKKELDQEKKKSQSEKTKSQLEIKRLQQELNQTKLREEELAEKIKELGKRRRVISENQETKTNCKNNMLGTLFLLLVLVLLLLGVIFWLTPRQPTPSKKETEETKIDWATERMKKNNRFKILPAHQFHLTKEAKRTDDALIFKQLLSEINDNSEELVFIPVNNPNFHWSLLVFETKTSCFYHYDTLGGANYEYVKPLVKELLSQIYQTNSPNLDKFLIKRHGIRQGNGWDCGVAVIAIIRRIRELKFKQS
ncbi:20089_t:CDS:2, partial [Gigaspora margarita]